MREREREGEGERERERQRKRTMWQNLDIRDVPEGVMYLPLCFRVLITGERTGR